MVSIAVSDGQAFAMSKHEDWYSGWQQATASPCIPAPLILATHWSSIEENEVQATDNCATFDL